MRSMTGYGRVEGRIANRRCVIELKTVNHRFCDINLKLPRMLGPHELTVKKFLESKITRGRVDATIQMDNGDETKVRLSLNFSLAQEYYHLITKLKQELNLAEDVSLLHILSLKDVTSAEKMEEDFESWNELESLLEAALDGLNEMRESEATIIRQDLEERIQRVHHLVSDMEKHSAQLTASYREKLLKRFQQLDLPCKLDETRILTEIFFLAERADITEEILRTKSHLQQMKDLLNASGAIGRKLEFILQELNREINTIGSKSGEIPVSQAVVEIKSDLEKMREQVQNIE